jgi:hypothetical protein
MIETKNKPVYVQNGYGEARLARFKFGTPYHQIRQWIQAGHVRTQGRTNINNGSFRFCLINWFDMAREVAKHKSQKSERRRYESSKRIKPEPPEKSRVLTLPEPMVSKSVLGPEPQWEGYKINCEITTAGTTQSIVDRYVRQWKTLRKLRPEFQMRNGQ